MLIKDFDKIVVNKCKILKEKRPIAMSSNDPMYCCNVWFEKFINDSRVPIAYCAPFRKYYLMVEDDLHAMFGITSCLQCGTQWPEDLVYEWGLTIEKELGFDPRYKKSANRSIPNEFTTDEWWKKRGF